ncbi:MAG: hypothetical protein ACLPY5_03170 [Candidatus Bathyarchaeia archaeon]
MASSYVIYENPITHEKFEIKAPLTCLVDPVRLRDQLGIPDYVNPQESFQIRKALVVLWASRNGKNNEFVNSPFPLSVALFGGGGFKLHCPSANRTGPFSRKIGDLDFITLKSDGESLVKVLCGLESLSGNMFFHSLTSGDRMFNNLRGQSRFRLHGIKDIGENGEPISGVVDILCDYLKFCHKLDIREEIHRSDSNFFTIGLENLIISKTQYIRKVKKDELPNSERSRILGDYDKKHFIVGMERKDMIDVAAALLDHELGDDADEISISRLESKLKQDWKLAKTVCMNLRNMYDRFGSITMSSGIKEDQTNAIRNRLTQILDGLGQDYRTRKGFLVKQWWEDVEDQIPQ